MINSTWPDFLKDCGGEVIVENYVRARSVFNRKYENNQVMWTGYFVDGKPANQLTGIQTLFGTDHRLNLLVKMSPSESVLHPDMALSVGTALYDTNLDLFN